MGILNLTRPANLRGNLTVTGNVTASTGTVTGKTLVASARRTASGGITNVTSTQAGSTLSGTGLTFITSASTVGSNIFHLPHPTAVGQIKEVVASVGTTDAVDLLVSATTSVTVFGCTGNAVRFSTGANKINAVTFVAKSTSGNARWAVLSAGAGVTVVGSSGV